MKKLLLLITLALSNQVFTQFGNTKSYFNVNVGVAIDGVEEAFIDAQKYQVNSIYENHLTFIELAITSINYDSWKNSYFKSGGAVTYKYFYRNTSNDSISSRYYGNLFGFDLLGVNVFPKINFVDLIFAGGVNMGSRKVKVGSGVKYKNFIFAPRLNSELRIKLGSKFSIAARVEKQFDISKPVWKLKKGGDVLNLKELNYNSLMFSAGIGWKIG